MHRFKNNIDDGWLSREALRMFCNMMRNWDGNVEDDDFFDIFRDDRYTSREEAKAMLGRFFKTSELADFDGIAIAGEPEEVGHPRFRRRAIRETSDVADDAKFTVRLSEVTDILQGLWNKKTRRRRCREMLGEWADRISKRKASRVKNDPMEGRMDEICRVLKLSELERDLFVYAMVRMNTCFDDIPVRRRSRMEKVFLAMATDWPCSDVTAALAEQSKLRVLDILDSDGDLVSDSTIVQYLEGAGGTMLEGQFFRKASVEDALPMEYYGKLAEDHSGILKRMISSSKTGRGVNILFYGAPGTGKTSFAKTLAKDLGLDLYEIRHGDRDGDRNTPRSRKAGIRICNEQAPRGRSIVLVDEADQLLRTNIDSFLFVGNSNSSEKGVINSILDDTKLPTIWISNTPARALDDSVRRRFDYSIRFEKLGTGQRLSIWRNSIEKYNLGKLVTPEMAEEFSRKYKTGAGGIAMVLENVRRMRPSKAKVAGLIESLMKPHCQLMGVQTDNNTIMPAKDYSLEGLNIRGEVGLDSVVAAVRRFRETKDGDGDPDRPRMNLLLWGPPGTGKTEFVKYLGRELDAKVSVKMGSDLLSMWVGGTEQNIADAFAEAEAANSILFLDEIDGLVQDRSGAHRSWEVTQVNELLHRMEIFKGVMVAATNFMDNLDAAIMRRFTFKLQFDYLDDKGKRLFFERMFKASLTDDEAAMLGGIPNLAPGDFRTVRQSLYYLGGNATNAMRLDGLRKESALKKGKPRSIGF